VHVQVQDIVVGTKSLTDVAKPSEIVSLFMDEEELAESQAKRKQAEEHGYIAPVSGMKGTRSSMFGDIGGGTGGGGEDEDDFFSMKRNVNNAEDEELGDDEGTSGNSKPTNGAGGSGNGTGSTKKAGGSKSGVKRKAPAEGQFS
jgi:hypothetical protein